MPRRIDIELTSARDDGTWTWRAAGAKAPKGTLDGSLLPPPSKVGDVLRVDAEFFVDGIQITGVLPPKGARQEPDRLELLAPSQDEPLVTSNVTTRDRDDRRPGSRRDGRREGPGREGGRPEGGRRREGDKAREGARREGGQRREGERPARRREGGGERPPRRTRPEPPPMPAVERPKAKRLRAGRAHRSALLESLPEEQRPIAEQVVLGGLPAVRQAIEKQNAERTAAGQSPIAAGPLLELAEKLVPKVRAAEWRDRAEAARRDLEHLDLRDLRSVVSAADAKAKDPEVRELAETLQAGLVSRVDAEHAAWLEELTATLDVGRIVRALRLSSRPPKAGAPLPAELAARLVEQAGAALTSDAAPERWVAVLDALAFAPVRDRVIPASLPKDLHPDVQATIARLATRIPKVAHIFEIAPDRNAPRPKIERRRPNKNKPKGDGKPKGDKPKGDKPRGEATKGEAPVTAPTDAAPADAPPKDEAPEDEASRAEVRVDESKGEAPVTAPTDAAPADAAPTDAAPTIEASPTPAPGDHAPIQEQAPDVPVPAAAPTPGASPPERPQTDAPPDARPGPGATPTSEPEPEPGTSDTGAAS